MLVAEHRERGGGIVGDGTRKGTDVGGQLDRCDPSQQVVALVDGVDQSGGQLREDGGVPRVRRESDQLGERSRRPEVVADQRGDRRRRAQRSQELGEIERSRWDAMTARVMSGRSRQRVDRTEDCCGTTFAETRRHHRREACLVVARSPHGFVGDRRESTFRLLDIAAPRDCCTQPFDRRVEAIDDLRVLQVVETVGGDPRRDR